MFPLSPAQRRLWFVDRLHGPDATYNTPIAFRLTGAVDDVALRAAIADVVGRHEPLRTVFPELNGEPAQLILDSGEPVPLTVVPTVETELDKQLLAAASVPFDLAIGPLLRAVRLAIGERDSILLLVVHHIVFDGWSLAPLVKDLSTAYRARCAGSAPSWPELPVQYLDYVLWQQELLGEQDDAHSVHATQAVFWRKALAGIPETVQLPTDHTRPPVLSHRGAATPISWSPRRHEELLSLAREHDCTLFMVIQAALAVVLTKLGAGEDICMGTAIAGRTEDALDDLVGLFVNTLVVRTDLAGDPGFDEVLRRVREVDLAAYANQDLPFDSVVEAVNPTRSPAHHPLFQVMLTLENTAWPEPDFGSVQARLYDMDIPAAKVDLNFALVERTDGDGTPLGLTGTLAYSTDLYDEETARGLVERLALVIDAVIATPGIPVSRISVMPQGEHDRVLLEWNATDRRLAAGTLHQEILDQARRTPDAPAVIFGGQRHSYAELVAAADRLARHLTGMGVTPGSVVAVELPRSAHLVVALLAVLKAGAAYLPLDPDLPAARIADMVDQARPVCVLTDRATAPEVGGPPRVDVTGDLHPAGTGTPEITPEHPAYVIFTSGSTGRPKGVLVAHRAIDNRLRWMQAAYPLTAGDRVLQKTPAGFDVSVWEFFWPLRVGAALVVAEPGEHRDVARLARTITEHGVTVLHFVPSMLQEFLAEPAAASCVGLRRVVCSGESLARDTAEHFHRVLPQVALENLYGPTEAAVDVTAHHCAPGERGPVPIGRPVWNTRLRVLDDRLRPCPVGVPGELYLAGAQLAEGYVGQPGLTAGRFVADPFAEPGQRMYRTGDVVRWRHDGEVEFLGRGDHQVKILGQRIELGELESVLLTDPAVGGACAGVRKDHAGVDRLVAYVTAAAGQDPDPAALRTLLSERLPSAAVPSVVTVLPLLPLNANGKLDRAALPEPRFAARSGPRPRTPLEEKLAAEFEAALGITGIGVEDDFFALGGHSLLAVRLVRRVEQATGLSVAVRDVFRSPSVAALAERIAGEREPDDPYAPVLRLRSGGDGPPLFFIHPGAGLGWCYAAMLGHVDPRHPIYALQARGLDSGSGLPESLPEMAEDYLALIRDIQPVGPYHLLGWSFGGLVAQAIAARLRAAGESVALLVLFDSYPDPAGPVSRDDGQLFATALENLLGQPPTGHTAAIEQVRQRVAPLADADDDAVRAVLGVGINNLRLMDAHVPETCDVDLVLVTAERDRPAGVDAAAAWREFATGRITTVGVDAGHHDLFSTASARTGAVLATALRGAAQDRTPISEEPS